MEITQETPVSLNKPRKFSILMLAIGFSDQKENQFEFGMRWKQDPPPLPATTDYICYENLKPISDYQNQIILYNLIEIFASFR